MACGFFSDCSAAWFLPLLFATLVDGEMRFACPRPQTPNSIILKGPCGSGIDEPFEDNYMELTPGPFTIELEETVARKGAPIRIALLDRSTNAVPCVLLDHIPHNDASSASPTESCKIGDYPLGRCYTGKSYLTVQIPDIDCDKCVLQMINIRADRHLYSCYQRDSGFNNCTSYYSCANVRIRPTPMGKGKGLATCTTYQQTLDGRWPYTPIIPFEIDLSAPLDNSTSPFDSTNFITLNEKPDWTLAYELKLSNINVTVGVGSTGIFKGYRPVRFFNRMKGTVNSLTAAERNELHQGLYRIQITGRQRSGNFKNFAFAIVKGAERYQPNTYTKHGVLYTPGGWLSGDSFVGGQATYPDVNRPAGECQPAASETYGCITTLFNGVVPRGLVTITNSRKVLYLDSAVSYYTTRVMLSTKWVDGKGTKKQVNVEFNRHRARGHFVEGAADISDHLIATSGRFPTRISYVIRRDSKVDVIYGPIQKGIKAVIMSGTVKLGVAFASFEEEKFVNIYVMPMVGVMFSGHGDVYINVCKSLVHCSQSIMPAKISNHTGVLEDEFTVTLNGPVIPTMTGPVLYNLTDLGTLTPLAANSYFLNASVPISGSQLLQYLWSGFLYINIDNDMSNDNRYHSGQLEKLTKFVCDGSMNIACKSHIILSVNGQMVDRGLANVPANGLATVLVANSETLMDISIVVQDLKPEETVTSVKLQRGGRDFVELSGYRFTNLARSSKKKYTHIQYEVPVEVRDSLKAGLLSLVVTTRRPQGVAIRTTQIEGRIDVMLRQTTTPEPTTTTTTISSTTTAAATTAPSVDGSTASLNTTSSLRSTSLPPPPTNTTLPPSQSSANATNTIPVTKTTSAPRVQSTPNIGSNTNTTSSQKTKSTSLTITTTTTTTSPLPTARPSNLGTEPSHAYSISGNVLLLMTTSIMAASRRFF